jgi:hypothetical protein
MTKAYTVEQSIGGKAVGAPVEISGLSTARAHAKEQALKAPKTYFYVRSGDALVGCYTSDDGKRVRSV